jgi:hypothetical protein
MVGDLLVKKISRLRVKGVDHFWTFLLLISLGMLIVEREARFLPLESAEVRLYICGTMAKGSNCYTFPIQLESFAMVPQIYTILSALVSFSSYI